MGLKLTGKRRRDDDDDAPASARNWDKTNEAHQCTNRYRDLYLAERPRTAHEKSALLLRLSTQHDDDEADNQPKQKKMRRGEAGAPIRNFPRPQAVSRYEPHKWFFAELMRQINGRATEEEDHLRITTLSWLRDHLRPADFEGLGLNQYSQDYWTNMTAPDLRFGSPTTEIRIPNDKCLVCVPVRHLPAHCELHTHLKPFMPAHLKYCCVCNEFRRPTDRFVAGVDLGEPVCETCRIDFSLLHSRCRRRTSPEMGGRGGQGLPRWFQRAPYRLPPPGD